MAFYIKHIGIYTFIVLHLQIQQPKLQHLTVWPLILHITQWLLITVSSNNIPQPLQYIIYPPISCITSVVVKHLTCYKRACFVNGLTLNVEASGTNLSRQHNCLLQYMLHLEVEPHIFHISPNIIVTQHITGALKQYNIYLSFLFMTSSVDQHEIYCKGLMMCKPQTPQPLILIYRDIPCYSIASTNIAAKTIASNSVAFNPSYNTVAIDYSIILPLA